MTLRAFVFPVEDDRWLGVLRIGLGLQVICYALSLIHDWNDLFAGTEHGLGNRTLAEAFLSTQSVLVPRLGWLIELGMRLGLPESIALSVMWWVLFISGGGLLAGVFSRGSAILAWFIHLCAAKSGDFISYGVDNFMTIGLFYLILSPLPDRFALEQRWRKVPSQDRHLLGFFRRVLQVHLCAIYFFGGLAKCLGHDWWNGVNLWRALTRPPFNVMPAETLIGWKHFFPIIGMAVCVLEIGYPFFVSCKRTRLAWLVSIVAMHLAIGAAMGMYQFALIMIALNAAAFGPGFAWGEKEDVDLAGDDRAPAVI